MPAQHIDDGLLDRYAQGILREDLVAGIEEHLLLCPACQDKLSEMDEFLRLFQAAATQVEPRPRPVFYRIWTVRPMLSLGALAAIMLLLIGVPTQHPRLRPPAIVSMQALRGPESAPHISAGDPFVLVFDLKTTAPNDYGVEIANATGRMVLSANTEERDGRLSAPIQKLSKGVYWVRIYRKTHHVPVAEYGLQVD